MLAAPVFGRGARGGWEAAGWDGVSGTLLALVAFCLGSSAIYLVNDIADVESDRAHPEKKRRPIASGELSVGAARLASLCCMLGALALGYFADGKPTSVVWVVAAYMGLNYLYSAWLKHVLLVDAFCIAAGFLLRVLAGGFAAHEEVSHWMLLCTLFLALFLALCKRRAECDLLGDGRGDHRAILREYDTGFLDQMVTILAACTIVAYAMYTVSEETIHKFGSTALVWTVPFVVFGLGRYLYLVSSGRGGGSPTRVLLGGDLTFVLNCLAWVGCVAVIIYGGS